MSNAVSSTDAKSSANTASPHRDAPAEKGKGKPEHEMDVDDEENGSEEEEEEEEDEDGAEEEGEEDDEDDYEEIDPKAILPTSRRTRGVKVDYNSAEALAKAGLEHAENEKDEEEDE